MSNNEEFQLFMDEAEERRMIYSSAKAQYEAMRSARTVDDRILYDRALEAAQRNMEEQRERFEEIVEELATFEEEA